MLEVKLRLQRPSRDGEGSQERAALGRRTWTTRRDTGQKVGKHGGHFCPIAAARVELRPWLREKVRYCPPRRADFDLFDTSGAFTPPSDTRHTSKYVCACAVSKCVLLFDCERYKASNVCVWRGGGQL